MSDSPLPLHKFSLRRKFDIPFMIGRIEELPAMARTPLPHRHTFYEIFWITGGSGNHNIDFEAYPIQGETLYFITPGQVHSWEIEAPISGYAILFTEDFLPVNGLEPITPRSFDFFHRVDQVPFLTIKTENTGPFHEICQHMLLEYQGNDYGRWMILQSQLRIMLIHAQRHYASSGLPVMISTTDRLVEDYIGLIDLHFREKQRVHEYAAMLSITPGHLTDTVRARTGMAASQFIYQRITLEAKRRLLYSEQTVAEVGYALNFQDPSYFTRFFRRECGVAPGEFRNNIRKKYQNVRNPSL